MATYSTRVYCAAALAALKCLDRTGEATPTHGPDAEEWRECRANLVRIIERNGYEHAAQTYRLLKARKALT